MKAGKAVMRTQTEISLRSMTENDLPAASALSKALSWPHRLEDWEFMFQLGEVWLRLWRMGRSSGRSCGGRLGSVTPQSVW